MCDFSLFEDMVKEKGAEAVLKEIESIDDTGMPKTLADIGLGEEDGVYLLWEMFDHQKPLLACYKKRPSDDILMRLGWTKKQADSFPGERDVLYKGDVSSVLQFIQYRKFDDIF